MAHRVLSEGLRAERAEVIFVDRGISHIGPSMRMRSHSTEHYGERAYERASEHADIRMATEQPLMAAHRS
jgi:hypothetical protein